VIKVKIVERVLIKVAVFQFGLLLFSQIIFHQLAAFPQLKQITKYEGVTENIMIKTVEAFKGK
jgi:hypothetical protein